MLSVNVQRGAAGDQDFKIGANRQKFRYRRRGLHQMLEIVQHEQHRRVRGLKILLEYFERRLPPHFPDSQGLQDHGSDQARIAYGKERNKMSAPRKTLDQAIRHLHRKTRFADPARTCDRDQAHTRTQQEFLSASYFFLSPHKPGSLRRKIYRAGLHLPDRLLREAVAYGCKFSREYREASSAGVRFYRRGSGHSRRFSSARFPFESLQLRANIG